MRLLNTKSLALQLFVTNQVPDYVILSHRWSYEELTFSHITKFPISNPNSAARSNAGFSKVQGACQLAARDGYDWIWIDSCCIDKSSSAELQEAINSMWNYYARSNICYVYMADVPDSEAGWDHRFKESEWFTRGWTLQELIAPVCVEFYSKDWSPIGTKLERYKEIADITKIDSDILVHAETIDAFSAAERLSWAAHRQVTREEDETYSLLGLFHVNIPMLYGEGRERAFIRFQEAIYNSMVDHTLFLFRYSLYQESQPLLADCPTRFCQRENCLSCESACATRCFPSNISYFDVVPTSNWRVSAHEQIMTTVTSYRNEISATIPILHYQEVANKLVFLDDKKTRTEISHVVVLNHTLFDQTESALCLLLFRPPESEGVAFYRTTTFPALLPHIRDFSLKKSQILICPDPDHLHQNELVETTFLLADDSFIVRSWSARSVNNRSTISVQGRLNTSFKIQTSHSRTSNVSPEISTRIADTRNPNQQISLRLIRMDQIWSIKELSEVKTRKRLKKQHTLFISDTLSDRCSVRLSDKKEIFVELRRLAASGRELRDGTIPQLRYQIVVKY